MRNHRLSCPLFMTAASHLPGDAGVDHIFTATHTAANRQNRRIIGMIISPDSHGIGVMVMTDTGREIPLIIRIIGPRMESSQCSCPGPDTVQAVAQLVDSPAHFIQTSVGLLNSLSQFGIRRLIIGFDIIELFIKLFHVHRISVFLAVADIPDGLAIGIDALVIDIRLAANFERVARQRDLSPTLTPSLLTTVSPAVKESAFMDFASMEPSFPWMVTLPRSIFSLFRPIW